MARLRSSVQRPAATGSPARWTHASQRASASCHGPGRVGSPCTTVAPAGDFPAEAFRESALTACPASSSAGTSARPMSPLAPVTKTFIGSTLGLAEGLRAGHADLGVVAEDVLVAVSRPAGDAEERRAAGIGRPLRIAEVVELPLRQLSIDAAVSLAELRADGDCEAGLLVGGEARGAGRAVFSCRSSARKKWRSAGEPLPPPRTARR